jgi:hypothetical protein
LPSEKERGSEKILNLAEQPLLLLMLALYDSQGNRLRASKGLDRTKLYDSLLRRFVIRERGKEKVFKDAEEKEREKALSTEMQRLGVAALGMYNRRKVHILSPELDDDLSFFNLEREVTTRPGKTLSQADLLLGSFFFIHKSKAQHSSGAEDTHEETAAFEFLHNTFGEFLTADFVLRRAVAQVQALRAAESNEALRSMIDRLMGTADGFERDWFASLVYTPLFTRPVVMEMIREWAPHVLRSEGLAEDDFVETLEKIVLNQIKRMLNNREMPQIMRKETAQEGYRVPFGDHPLVGHIAIYSINLILLRLVAGKRPLIFDESEVASHEDGTRPWDRLMHIWRSWFALGNLNGLTAVMLAERTNSSIKVTAKDKFQAVVSKSKLHEFHNVALSLGDNVSAGITGIYLFDPTSGSDIDLNSMEQRLSSEGFDPGFPLIIARLHILAQRFPDSPKEFVHHGRHAIQQALEAGRTDQLENVCLIITRVLEEQMHARPWMEGDRVFRDLLDPSVVVEIAMREPRSARMLFDLGRKLHDFAWLDEFSGRFVEFAMREMPRSKMFESGALATNWIRLLQEVVRARGLSPFNHRRGIAPEFFERVVDPRYLLELSERSPKGALAYLQIMREMGGGRYFERLVERDMGPEFFERLFHPRHLLDLSERNPEVALVYLQILREMGGGQYFERFVEQKMGRGVIERLFHPRQLLELSERNPEVALAYLRILHEIGGEQYFERFVEQKMGPGFFEQMIDPHRLLELTEHNPEGALAYLQILREMGGGQYFERFVEQKIGPGFFERMIDPRRLLDLSERNPEVALAYLQVLRELSGGRYFERFVGRRMGPEVFERIDPRHLLELSERNPGAALAYVQILRELGGGQYLERFVERELGPEFFQRMVDPRDLLEFGERRVSKFSLWLACARLFDSERFNQLVIEAISGGLRHGASAKRLLSLLPITSLPDLRWLAEQTRAPELQSLLGELPA